MGFDLQFALFSQLADVVSQILDVDWDPSSRFNSGVIIAHVPLFYDVWISSPIWYYLWRYGNTV